MKNHFTLFVPFLTSVQNFALDFNKNSVFESSKNLLIGSPPFAYSGNRMFPSHTLKSSIETGVGK